MYKFQTEHQISFMDFNQSCGMQLDPSNEWVRLADRIPWDAMEQRYAELFPSPTGRPAKPFRMAFAALIIQKRKNLSDRHLVREIMENPYLQYFLGLHAFQRERPFRDTALVGFRKRLGYEFMVEANEILLRTLGKEDESGKNKREEATDESGNEGTAILDATCSPSNIKYPQDFQLLNEAREKLEGMIDFFHKTYAPWQKPRTYRRLARKNYLALAKAKKRPANKVRATIRKQLGYIRRDLGYLAQYMGEGYALPHRFVNLYLTILELYRQQRYMYENKVHRVDDRIVSLSQPYLRPIVRGKAKAPVEFGAKYDVSIDENGHARLEKVSFDSYNESTILQDAIERYKARTGHYPKRALVDQIYRTRKNIAYCKEHGIRMSGPKLGRPAKGRRPDGTEKQDNRDRIEVERFFSVEKRCYGGGLIMTKLDSTTLASIALSVLVTNLFVTMKGAFFWLFFVDCDQRYAEQHYFLLEAS